MPIAKGNHAEYLTQLTSRRTRKTRRADLEDLKRESGLAGTTTPTAVKKAADEDMKNYGGGVADEASRTYRKVLETVFNEGQGTGRARG